MWPLARRYDPPAGPTADLESGSSSPPSPGLRRRHTTTERSLGAWRIGPSAMSPNASVSAARILTDRANGYPISRGSRSCSIACRSCKVSPMWCLWKAKDADALAGLGFAVSCNAMGAGKWRPESRAAARPRGGPAGGGAARPRYAWAVSMRPTSLRLYCAAVSSRASSWSFRVYLRSGMATAGTCRMARQGHTREELEARIARRCDRAESRPLTRRSASPTS